MVWGIIAAVIAVVASAGVYYQQKKMEAQAAKQAQEAKAVQVSGHDSNRGLYTVYGQTLVGSTIVWKVVTDKEARMTQSGFTTISAATGSHLTTNKDHKNNRWLYRAVTLCNGPVTEITNVTIDDEGYRSPRFTNKTNKHFATTYSVGPTAGQNFSALRNAYASDFSTWASDAVGKGVAYAIERLYLHKDKPAYQGEPQTRYRVKGRALYDPRKDSTSSAYDSNLGTSSHRADTAATWEYSDNPVLALLDYMRSGEYGRGLDLSVIDIDSIAVSADKCDVLVDIPQRLANDTGSVVTYYDPETGEVYVVTVNGDYPYYRADQQTTGVNANKQRRFRINMAVDPSKEILDNIQEILNVFRGNLSYANGKYFVHMADVASPVLTLNDDDIIGGLKIANGDRSQRMNRATVKFINQAKQYKTDQVSWPSLDSNEDGGLYATYLTQDEDEKLHRTFTIKGCTDFYQAQDTAEFLVRDSRSNLSISGTFGSRCFGLIPGDVVALDYDSSGFSGKYFRVIQTQVDLVSMNVGLQLKEYDSSVYTWNTSRGNEPLGLSWQEEVVNADPTNLTIGTIATNTTTRSDGSASQTLTIPFSDVPEAAQYVEIGVATNNTTEYETHLVFDTENQTQAEIPIARDNQTYAVRARYFATNSYGTLMPSAYTETTHAVASLSGTKLDGIATGATQNTGALADLDTVDTDQIDNDAVTIAKLDTSLESTNYQAGVSGWKLTKAGVFEAGSGTFRGAVTATSITLDGVTIPSSDLDQSTQDSLGLADSAIQDTDTGLDLGITAGSVGGITINSTSVESTNFSAGVSGFKLASNGSLEVGDGTFRGSITATSLSLASTVAIGGDNLPIDIYAGVDSTTVNKDPYFAKRDGTRWVTSSGQSTSIDADSEFTFKTDGSGLPTGRSTFMQSVSNDDSNDQFFSEFITLESDKAYRITVWVQQPSGTKRNYLLMDFRDSSNVRINNASSPISDATGFSGGIGTYHYWTIANQVFPTTFTKYEIVIGGNSSIQPPSNATSFNVGALTLRSSAGSTTTVNWAQYHVEEIDTAATNASVTSIGGVTITSNSLYQGTGAFNTSTTGFYLDSTGQFSLKDKLSFDGTDLTLDGDITARDLNITNATVTGTLSANNLAIDGVTLDTNSSGEIIIKDGGVSNDQIGASSVAASNIIAGSVSKVNPVTQTQNVYRWAGYDDAGNVVNAVPSGITVEYDATEKALELRNDGNVGMRSDTFVIDQNSIYKITFKIKKSSALGNWYVGAYQHTSAITGSVSDGGNVQTQASFTQYHYETRASSSTTNAYFISGDATTSYVQWVCYLIGANVSIDEVPSQNTQIIQAADGYSHVGLRILNWTNTSNTTSLFVKDLSVVEMTATTIIAENISTTNLAAINSNLGAIDAGSLNIGGGNFTVSTTGAMTATGATISGAITATSLSLDSSVNIGSGNLDSTVVSGAEAGATANQDSTATILGGNHTGTVNNVSASTVTSGAAAGATALQIADISEIISEGNIPTGKLTLNSAGNKTVVFSGNSLTSSGGTDNTWDTHVYSSEHYDSPLVLQFEVGTTGLRYMVGLNEDPTANTSYSSIDYAFYQNVNTFTIYESGSQAVPDGGTFTYAAGDKLSIVYDGTNIYYYHNDTLKRTVSNVGVKDFYFDSSLYDSNQMSINDIRLAPISNIDYGSIGGITIEPNRLYQGTGTWANSNTGFYLDNTGKFSLKDKMFFNPTDNTLTVDGNITADVITAKQNLVVLGDLQASSVATGSITRAMLSQDALDEIFGSLASSVGGSNGDFKEGSGTFTPSGGSVTLGTSSDKFDHGVSDVDVEFNINTFFYTTTNYSQAQAQATLTFEATADGTFNDLNSADKTHTLQFLEYDLSSYYGYTYLVYHINTAITKTFTSGSGSDLTDNVDVQFRVAVSGVGSAFTGQTIPFDVAANEGVTGVTSTGGNADTLDNLDSTAFLRSNTNDTFDGDLTITGQLILNGSIDQYNVTDLDVTDKTITVNSGNTASLSDGAGLIVDRGTATDASILWNETSNAFDISHSITIQQPSPYIVLKDTTDNDDQRIIFKNNTDGVDYEIATKNDTSNDSFTFYSASQEIVSRIGSNNIFEAHSDVVKSLKPLEVTGTVSWTGGSSTNANTAYGWGDHASGGYSDEYKNYGVASGADHDTHHWNKTHAAYSNNGSSPTYIVLTTNVPQDNYSMGGFTLVFQNHYSESDEGDTVTIYGYWNPEVNSGFIGFRYHASNPDCAPTIQVGRNTSGKTVFLISNEAGNYAQVVAKDLWLGYAASSAASSWGDSWAFSEASTTGNISNLNTLNRVGITAAQRNNWNTAYGWGDHSLAGYLTSYTEADTLDSVTDRGATTTNAISTGAITSSSTGSFKGGLGSKGLYIDSTANFANQSFYAPGLVWRQANGTNIAGIRGHINAAGVNQLVLGTGWLDQEMFITPTGVNITGTLSSAAITSTGSSSFGHVGVDGAANASYSLYVHGHIAQASGSIYSFGDVVIGEGALKKGSTTYISSSGVLANVTANADIITSGVLNHARIPIPLNGDWWNGGFVKVQTDGVMEVGKYLDFHTSDSGGNTDFDVRVTATAGAIDIGGDLTVDDISSGAITSSGKLKINQAGSGTSNSESDVAAISGQNQGGTINALSLVNSVTGANNNGVSIAFHNASNWSPTGKITLLQEATGTNTDARMVFQTYRGVLHDALVLDHDQNAIVFGHMYAQGGNITAGTSSIDSAVKVFHSDGTFSVQKGWGMEFARDASYLRPNNDDARTMYFGASTLRWNQIQLHTTSLKMGAVEFLDDSRNATLGTISAAAITSSGNLLLDVDNAEINLKSGVGTTSGAVNWTFNTTGTNYASIKLPYATRNTTGLHLDSGYPITIDSASGTGIKFDVTGGNRATITSGGLSVNGTGAFTSNVDVATGGGSFTVGGNLGAEYWTKAYSVSNTNIEALTNADNTSLENGGAYRFTGHIDGTGTDNSSRAVFWNENGTWYVNVTGQSGTSSNHIQFLVSGGVPSVKTYHSSNYTVRVWHERLNLNENTGSDNSEHFFGADAYLSKLGDSLSLNADTDIDGNLSAGNGGNISMDGSANGQVEIKGSGYQGAIALDATAMRIYHNSASRSLVLGTDDTARMSISSTGVFDFYARPLANIGSLSTTGPLVLQVSSSDTAHQRVDTRDETGDESRAHWYGVTATGGTSNFRHAWYDGGSYVNVTAASNTVTFGGSLAATSRMQVGAYTSSDSSIIAQTGGIQLRIGSVSITHSPYLRLQGSNGTNGVYADIKLDTTTSKLVFNDPGNSSGSIGQSPMTLDASGNLEVGGDITSNGDIFADNSIQLGSGYNLSWGGTYNTGNPTIAASTNAIFFYPTGNTDAERLRITAAGLINAGTLTSDDITSSGYLQATSYLYTRDNLRVLNNAGTGWNTWATRSSGNYNLNVGSILSGAITSTGDIASSATLVGEHASAQGFYTYDASNHLRVTHPGGAGYRTQTSTVTGAIKIVLPQSWTSTMMRMTIKVYEYTMGESFTIDCGGYNYTASGGQWINTFAYITGQGGTSRNFTVRFGYDGTKCCIYIGELNSGWSYPQISVTDFQAGYNNTGASLWRSGWDIAFESSAFGTVTKTHTQTDNQRYHRDIYVGGQAVVDANRNLTNIASLDMTASTTADIDLNRSAFITFYGSSDRQHSIGSRNNAGTATDDIRINTFGNLFVNLDSNNNNSSSADFVIGRHGSATGAMDLLLSVSGEDGDLITEGNVTAYGSPSDIRLKDNVKRIEDPIGKVKQLDGITFNYKKDGSESTGLIAQQLLEVLPQVVYETNDLNDDKTHYAVRYGQVVGLLVEAIKEQQDQIDSLKDIIEEMKNGNN